MCKEKFFVLLDHQVLLVHLIVIYKNFMHIISKEHGLLYLMSARMSSKALVATFQAICKGLSSFRSSDLCNFIN